MKNCGSSEEYQPGLSVKVVFKLFLTVWVEFEYVDDDGHSLG